MSLGWFQERTTRCSFLPWLSLHTTQFWQAKAIKVTVLELSSSSLPFLLLMSLSIQSVISAQVPWPWAGLIRGVERWREFWERGKAITACIGVCPWGSLCFLALEGVSNSNVTTSTGVHRLMTAKINREVESRPLVKGGSLTNAEKDSSS